MAEPDNQSSSQAARKQRSKRSDPVLPWGGHWDQLAQKHFDRQDWIELAATVLLSLATIVAAWSAYQSTRWSGVQSLVTSTASAKRIEATQQNAIYTSQVQLDAIAWISYLENLQAGNKAGAAFLRSRFRSEFTPAFEAWLAQAPAGQIPPGTPFDLPDYQPAAKTSATRLNAEADALSAEAAVANRVGDDFVLVAVVMASVLFCAGVCTKVRGRKLRLAILALGTALFVGGLIFMLGLPHHLDI